MKAVLALAPALRVAASAAAALAVVMSMGLAAGCSAPSAQEGRRDDAPGASATAAPGGAAPGAGVAAAPSLSPSLGASAASSAAESQELAKWCTDVRAAFLKLDWKFTDPCFQGIRWVIGGHSVEGRPLVYAEFGDEASVNTTVVFTMVHGDEVTPLFLGVRLAKFMIENREKYARSHVVIAPLVNPDGFFRKPRTRMNAKGVDVNRNFATQDWETHALKAWKTKFRSDPRRFPGPSPRSEPETLFQEELIRKFKPQKVLSVHAPLNFLDYDGPTVLSLKTFPKEYVQECLKLRKRLKAISSGFFPGSLGNFAGQELGIPTLTLELPSADPKSAYQFWMRFKEGIQTMIDFVVPPVASAGRSQA